MCGRIQFRLIAAGCQLKYIQDSLQVELEEEKCILDEYIPAELAVLKRQHKVIE